MADSLSREAFVKGVAAGAAALSAGFPAFVPSRGEAAEALKIGLIDEFTGPVASYAVSESRGAQIALDAWNARGGVLGRKIQLVREDCQDNPGVTVEKVRKLVNQDKVAAIFGTMNSGDSLAASSATNALGTLFMVTGGHADAISGKQCHWNTFQSPHSTWAETQATGYSIAKQFGKRWYLLTPDYAFGHALAAGYQSVIAKVGGQIVGNDLVPVGTSDFSTYLTKVEGTKPDVLIVLLVGTDFTNALKQAGSFGLLEKIPVAGPQVEYESFYQLPPEVRVGYWGLEWYYKSDLVLGKGTTLGHAFTAQYLERYHEPPTARSASAYMTLDRMLWAFGQAKTTDPVKVARTLEEVKFTTLWEGTSYYRAVDHHLMWPMWFAAVRPHGTPSDPYDVFDVIDRQEEPGKIAHTPAEKAKVCHLNYPS